MPEDLAGEFSQLLKSVEHIVGPTWMLRSSATDETVQERGNYLSLECRSADDTNTSADALHQIFSDYREKGGAGRMCLILQKKVDATNEGYLSNELRLVDKPYRWIVQAEITTADGVVAETTSVSAKQGSAFSINDPLICTSMGELKTRLRSVAQHFWKSSKGRLLIEWCWDGSRLWLVQRDQCAEKTDGLNPFNLLDKSLSAPSLEDGVYFKRHQPGSSSPWPKLKKVATYGTGIAPPPHRLFYANAATIRQALTSKSTRDELVEEINALTNGRAVIRTDKLGGGFNLDRTHTVDGAAAAEWLRLQLEKVENDAETVFILHAFIHARAAAWSYYKRGDSHVRIDGLWGLADGMQYYPCDTYVYHPRPDKEISTLRFKSHVLIEAEGGEWKIVDVDHQYARKRSLTKAQVKEIAKRTIEISGRTDADAQVMWFAGIPEQFGLGENLPWFSAPPEQNLAEHRSHLLRSITISTIADIEKLEGLQPNSVKVILKPDGENIRSDKFIETVNEVCTRLNLPVEIQGSILSHAYHQLDKAGVHVFCAEPGKTHLEIRQRKSFDKIVRDNIPTYIENKGESVTSSRLDDEELERALVGKLLEETSELLSAKSPEHKAEELADMLEVLRGFASASKISFEEVERKAEKKRRKRGGFELGVVLRITNLASDEPDTQVLFSELKNDLRSRVKLSDLSDRGRRTDKAVLPADRLLSNEIIRKSLQLKQQTVTIRAEMESGNVVIVVEGISDLPDGNQLNFIDEPPPEDGTYRC